MKITITPKNDCLLMDAVTEVSDTVKPSELGLEFPYCVRPGIDEDGNITHTAQERVDAFLLSLKKKYDELAAERETASSVVQL